MSTFDQQLDLDGGAHDIAPEHSQEHLFEFPTNLKGQTAMNTDQQDSITTDEWGNIIEQRGAMRIVFGAPPTRYPAR